MSRRRDPNLGKAVEAARKLLEADPDLSKAAACRQATQDTGTTLNVASCNYRTQHAPPVIETPDDLLETPTDTAEIPVFVRDYSSQPKHLLYPIGDLHIGAKEHAGDRLDEWLKFIR